jgi:hypothetical protein
MNSEIQSEMVKKKDLDCIKDLIHRFATALEIISEEENSFFNL